MANKSDHQKATIAVSLPSGIVAGLAADSLGWSADAFSIGALVTIGCLLGLVVHPDLDQEEAHMPIIWRVLSLAGWAALLIAVWVKEVG